MIPAARPPASTPNVVPGWTAVLAATTVAAVFGPAAARAQTPASAPADAGDLRARAVAERYREAAGRILEAALSDDHAYRRLQVLCDDIGHRLSGSEGLERAVSWAAEELRRDGQENVRLEPVTVPKWSRGEESLELLEPRRMALPMLGLGGSVATPPEGITADVVVVADLNELTALGSAAAGKIVLFDYAMGPRASGGSSGYGDAVQYRVYGARWAVEHGAVAALVRSATARSLQSPHTGSMNYMDARRRIPAASVTTEHAEMLHRFQKRGIPIRARLRMEARMEGTAESANVVGELLGREIPEEIVVVGGHLDSWDVGQGAHDDGGGCVMSMEALRLLRRLDLRPRRTIRVVLFTNEENGLAGARAYVAAHADELPRHAAAIESDSGTFSPKGFSVEHIDAVRQERAVRQVRELLSLTASLGADQASGGGSGADVGAMKPAGVALLGLQVDGTHYFDYHHTHADTLDKVDPADLNRGAAALAILSYVLADMPGRLGDEWPAASP